MPVQVQSVVVGVRSHTREGSFVANLLIFLLYENIVVHNPVIVSEVVGVRMSKYDLVIYGASGFTGQFVIEYVARAAEEHSLAWAVAGRSEGRVRAALARAGAMLGSDLSRGEAVLRDLHLVIRYSPSSHHLL